MCLYGVAQGPLNYKKDLRLKLNWEEIEVVFKSLGYTFLSTSQVPLPPASTPTHLVHNALHHAQPRRHFGRVHRVLAALCLYSCVGWCVLTIVKAVVGDPVTNYLSSTHNNAVLVVRIFASVAVFCPLRTVMTAFQD